MNRAAWLTGLCFLALAIIPTTATAADDDPPGPDAKPQPGVPAGQVFSFNFDSSKIFPGTHRQISVYLPAQYNADRPACLYVGLDGLGLGVTTVFDNLIHKGELPVIIGVGIQPGTVPSADGHNPRFNRSAEFDGLSDALARFVIDEVLPEVQRRKTPGGLPIRISNNPNDRATGGASTGGIAAFTLAWQRPDQFRRVFTAIGTFVCMRGGDRYPMLVRETEPKPLRVFQQDGSHDEWDGGPEVGDWWFANQTLDRGLAFAGYEHAHAWGTGTHNSQHAEAVLPEAMRFLWKDWPKPVEAHPANSGNVILRQTIDPASKWQPVAGVGACDGLAVTPEGAVVFRDAGRPRKVGLDGAVSDAAGIPAGPFAFTADGNAVTPGGLDATCLTITHAGDVYATDAATGQVWLVRHDRAKVLLDEGLKQPSGIAISPDGLWLAVMQRASHVGYSYQLKADGTVQYKQPFYWLHVPDDADDSGAGGMCFDHDGRLYVATRMGVQIVDRNGRSRATLPLPLNDVATSVCFAGERFQTLFVTGAHGLYRRRMNAVGAPSFAPPYNLPPWGPG